VLVAKRRLLHRPTWVLVAFALLAFVTQAHRAVPRAPTGLAPAQYFEHHPQQWFQDPSNGATRRLGRSLAAADRRLPRSASLLVGACPAAPEIEADAERMPRGFWAAYLLPGRDVRGLRPEWMVQGSHVLCTEGSLSKRRARQLAVLPTGHRLYRMR
jgi:hypothetical protein